MAEHPSIPDPVSNFKDYSKSLFDALINATKVANAIPTDELPYFKSLDKDFSRLVDTCGGQILSVANTVINHVAGDHNTQDEYVDLDDVLLRYDKDIVDVVDNLLEKADVCLDELSGRLKPQPLMQQQQPTIAQLRHDPTNRGALPFNLIHAQNIPRPQIRFKQPIDNSPNTPFIWKIKEKPNAMVPLDYSLTSSVPSEGISSELRPLPHPYEYEITHITYPNQLFEESPPRLYNSFEETSATWVADLDTLKEMITKLESATEIAVDLEHHNYRSFQGFVCLMQISTREEDFIIDTLELREELSRLNGAFTDPRVVKVLHGAESDIIWLQRDFGIYIVGLFDTFHASHLLEFSSHSLAGLLAHYCNVTPDKKYQLADWRIRPLPQEMLRYARSDTHYLLYIYDCMRNALIAKGNPTFNLMNATLQRSSETSLKRYQKDGYDALSGEGPGGWRNLLSKWSHPLNSTQFAVFKALHAWRDTIAREQDESTRYVLPNHMLFTIVDRCPIESSGIIACCNPCPPLVKMHSQDLAELIKQKLKSSITQSSTAEKMDVDMPKATHIRFQEHNSLMSSSINGLSSVDVNTAKMSRDHKEDRIIPLRRIDVSDIRVMKSVLFGDEDIKIDKNTISANNISEEKDGDAYWEAVAEKIRSSLVLSIPGVKAVRPAALTNENDIEIQEQPEHVFIPAEQRMTRQGDQEVIVLNDANKGKNVRKRPHEFGEDQEVNDKSTTVEDINRKGEGSIGQEASQNGETDDDDDDDEFNPGQESITTVVSRRKRKRDRKRKKAPQENNDKVVSEETRTFTPHDYSTTNLNISGLRQDGLKKGAGKSADNGKFNPYGTIDIADELKAKPPRGRNNPSSGNRSMTFSNTDKGRGDSRSKNRK